MPAACNRAACVRPGSTSASPFTRIAGLLRRLDRARDGLEVPWSFRRGRRPGPVATAPPSFHAASAGSSRNALPPGGPRLAAYAAAAFGPASAGAVADVRPGGERPHERLDVRGQRRIEVPVIGRVIADDVDRRRKRTPGVVQVGGAVEIAGAEMQQRHRRPAGHARVAVRCARCDALEQAQDRSDPRFAVQCGDEVHLARAGIGEAGPDAAIRERPDERIGAVHASGPSATFRSSGVSAETCRKVTV